MPQQATVTPNKRTRASYSGEDLVSLLSTASARMPLPMQATAPASPGASAHGDLALVPRTRNSIFKLYAEYEEAISAASAAQWNAENEVFGFTLTSRPRTDGIEEIAKQAISYMIHEAQKRFSNQYTTLSIATSDVLEATGQANWREAYQHATSRPRHNEPPRAVHEVPVDLDKIWAYLEETYGGEAGQTALYKQLVPLLINRLHLNAKDMRRTAKAVIAYQSVRSSPASFGSKTGPYKIYERRDVNEVFDALRHAFEWVGLDALSIALKPDRHKIGDFNFKYDLRDKFSFPGLDIVTFKDSWDYKFDPKVAEKLQLFLGTFAP